MLFCTRCMGVAKSRTWAESLGTADEQAIHQRELFKSLGQCTDRLYQIALGNV